MVYFRYFLPSLTTVLAEAEEKYVVFTLSKTLQFTYLPFAIC